MFTCLNQHTNEHLTSISKRWRGCEGELRKLGRSDCLVCTYCEELLTFRCGEFTRPHFAHRQASKCPLDGKRSPEEIEAKAQLFEVLEQVWEGDVRMDALLEDETQPIDFLLLKGVEPFFAYWILSKSIRKFDAFTAPASHREIPYHILYTGSAHKLTDNLLMLQKQQRDQICYTKIFDSSGFRNNGHLTFIDTEASELVIYRGLSCEHSPNGYGFELVRRASVHELNIHTSGELVTAEDQAYSEERIIQIQRSKEEAHRKMLAKREADQAHLERQQEAKQSTCIYCKKKTEQWSILLQHGKCVCSPCLHFHNENNSQLSFTEPKEVTPERSDLAKLAEIYICNYCKKRTSEWSISSPGKGSCVCHDCLPEHNNRSIVW